MNGIQEKNIKSEKTRKQDILLMIVFVINGQTTLIFAKSDETLEFSRKSIKDPSIEN